jgi:predicted house-cleaning noncanonical NTP pyrophosphatase (MazG superfamily)
MGARLVRDRIGELEWGFPEAKAGLRPVVGIEEHRQLLIRKLLEEVGEFLAAPASSINERFDEAADILAVLVAMLRLEDELQVHDGRQADCWNVIVYDAEIVTRARRKWQERGGFELGMVWEGTSI